MKYTQGPPIQNKQKEQRNLKQTQHSHRKILQHKLVINIPCYTKLIIFEGL
jgi:hypothetical protein